MKEFLFDMTLNASIRLKATSIEEARQILLTKIECADTNFGAFANGDPIVGETSIANADMLECVEIDGETFEPTEDERWIRLAICHHASFTLCEAGKFKGCWYVRDDDEESLVIDGRDDCRTKAAAARAYCEDRGYNID